ncbi:MAG: hypothetical protein ACRC35_10650 [Angustibacter sp.]
MIAEHRGRWSLRRTVVIATTVVLRRSYAGRHRLVPGAVPVTPVLPAVQGGQRASHAIAGAAPVYPAGSAGRTILPVELPDGGPRLVAVAVSPRPDPLLDTVPHPVVKLFPIPPEPEVTAPAGVDADSLIGTATGSSRPENIAV